MSFSDGWAAIHLETPPRVPHTEYSIERHWDLVSRVTGYQVNAHSPSELQTRASFALMNAWNFDFRWATLLGGELFSAKKTDMGHAEYEQDGVDRRDTVYCPFKTPEEVLAFDFLDTYGPVDRAWWKSRFEADYLNRCHETPDMVNMTGIYVTLVSGFIDIFGWNMLLLAAGTDPEAFGQLANRYSNYIQAYFDALAEAEVPVVMIHDDMVWSSGPFISPAWYRKYVFPNYRQMFSPLIDSGKKIIFTSDGDYSLFIDDLAGCGIHGFVMEPFTDMAYIAEKYGKTHAFIGNADTRILLNGTQNDIRNEVARCMRIGKPFPGFFLAVGNHIPANTPVENVLFYQELYEEMSVR